MIEKETNCIRLMAAIRNGLKLSLGSEQEVKRVVAYIDDSRNSTGMSFDMEFEGKEYRIMITPL